MNKAVWSAVTALGLLVGASPAAAQLATQDINAIVNINSVARLTVSGDVNFPDTDPDAFPTMTAPPVTVSARARVAPGTSLTVTVEAGNAHFDPTSLTIPVNTLEWTVSGAPFVDGTMDTTPVSLGNWTGPGNQSTTQTYSLPNLWSYAPGVHTVVLTYTLSTP